MFAQTFCLFWSQNGSTFYFTYYIGICPNILPFLEPKWEHFLFYILHSNLPQYFAFFGAKMGALSISLTT